MRIVSEITKKLPAEYDRSTGDLNAYACKSSRIHAHLKPDSLCNRFDYLHNSLLPYRLLFFITAAWPGTS